MNNRKLEKKVLIIVAGFYIAVSIFAVAILSFRGNLFSKKEDVREAALENEEQVYIEKPEPVSMEKYENFDTLPPEEEPESEEAATEEASTEEASTEEAPEDDGTEYYSFIANNTTGRLNVRRSPSVKDKIVYRMYPGDGGYVITIDDEWTYVSVSDIKGYCANEYLALQEISESDYPEELKELVGTGF
ncbi:MAG: SH3 domain-containing protein [Lachnospiraceae bacterium]|nr:SH3 domain-containing protein [Lachnospiraceae bacterium]